LQTPCENCRKAKRHCSSYYHAGPVLDSPSNPSPQTPISPATTNSYSTSGQLEPIAVTFLASQTTDDIFSIENWDIDIDPFPSLLPFWPDPSLFSPPTASFPSDECQAFTFDTFDRSRIIHDLNQVPEELQQELPSPAHLSILLQQYFKYVEPMHPTIHLPSFSVKTASTTMLLLLLATGDVYSEVQTVEAWAREAFKYMVTREIASHEKRPADLPMSTITGIMMWLSQLAFSGNPEDMLLASHCRITLHHACQKLIALDEEDTGFVENSLSVEAMWIKWIEGESRRRLILAIHLVDVALSTYSIGPFILRLSESSFYIPESDKLWYATSCESWLSTRQGLGLGAQTLRLRLPDLLSNFLQTPDNLHPHYLDVLTRQAVVLGIQEMVGVGRKLRKIYGESNGCSAILMDQCRAGLEAWKICWQVFKPNATKALYNAVMSAWCWTELLLNAPDIVVSTVSRVAGSSDPKSLRKKFLAETEAMLSSMDAEGFNNLMAAAAASIFHIEAISEFNSIDECLSTMRATVYPYVVTSFFAGGICLWVAITALKRAERVSARVQTEIRPLLMAALGKIRWRSKEGGISIVSLFGELLKGTNVWSKFPIERGC